MTLFYPIKRTSLLIPSGPLEDRGQKHLCIVLTDPCTEKLVLHVGISTIYKNIYHDPACVLDVGDHEFIKHKSYVFYRYARVRAVSEIVRGVRDGKLAPKQSVSESVFAHICNGLLTSIHTPQGVVDYYKLQQTSPLDDE